MRKVVGEGRSSNHEIRTLAAEILRSQTTYVLAVFEACSAYDPRMRSRPGTVLYRRRDGHKA